MSLMLALKPLTSPMFSNLFFHFIAVIWKGNFYESGNISFVNINKLSVNEWWMRPPVSAGVGHGGYFITGVIRDALVKLTRHKVWRAHWLVGHNGGGLRVRLCLIDLKVLNTNRSKQRFTSSEGCHCHLRLLSGHWDYKIHWYNCIGQCNNVQHSIFHFNPT